MTIIIVVVVAIIVLVAAVILNNHVANTRKAKEGCSKLIEMLNDESRGAYEIQIKAPVRENGMEEHFRAQCPKAMAELDEIDGNIGGASAPDSEPEFDDAPLAPSDEEPTLLEKQCYAANEIATVGNGPGSPYSDYTDEDIEDARDFVAANC